ncbi:S41 family peptidase [Elioraea rosea]|uniref:S41 family peptidase n=1 Tax=Elioraea rosea TaxID=2492390 RepID=UPI001182284B|nr:S41 family peptidase [Elioraea rosea]
MGKRARPAPLLCALAALLAGPSAAAEIRPDREAVLDQAVFASALAALRDRHIEQLVPAQRMAAGLKGLAVADPSITVVIAPDRLELGLDSTSRTILPAPRPADAEAWGRTGAAALNAATAASPRLARLKPAQRRGLVLDEMASGLDPYSRFVPLAEASAQRRQRLGSGTLGLSLEPEGNGARVGALVPEGPAWRAGLALGDKVIEIDGRPTAGLALEELEAALAGASGTAARLVVQRRAAPAESLLLVRAPDLPPTASLSWHQGWPVIAVSGFSRETGEIVGRLVAGLAARQPAPTGLILDLRGNRGGLLQQAVAVSDVFLADGEVVAARGRHPDASRSYLAGGADLAEGMAIVVLVDGATASAAEAVAAALQELGRAVVVGSATRGKGLIQYVHPLPDGSELHITWARLLGPRGGSIQGRGVMPELCTSRGEAAAREEAGRLISASHDARAGFAPAAASEAGGRSACPAAEGGALDITAALWLLRRSLAEAPAPPGEAAR